MTWRVSFALIAITIVIALQISYPVAFGTRDRGITGGVVENFQNSLTLPGGATFYVYGLVTGGGFPTTGFANGEYASVENVDGFLVAALAFTTSSANSFSTNTIFYALGGAPVSGFSFYTASFGSNNAPSASSASDTFASSPGSLVVIVAIGGGEQSISISGLPGLIVDATNFNGVCNQGLPPVILIGHVHLSPGVHTVTEQTSQCAAGQDPNHAGDIVGVFVFSRHAPDSQD